MNKTAGTETRTIQGQGWTEKEALDNAMQEDLAEYGHGEGYGGGWNSVRDVVKTKRVRAPKRPTKVKVTKQTVKKGPVEKAFVISTRWHTEGYGDLQRDRRFTAHYKTQATVLKAAKELALEYGTALMISLAAFCQGNTHLADVVPEKGQKGVWNFTVDFRS